MPLSISHMPLFTQPTQPNLKEKEGERAEAGGGGGN